MSNETGLSIPASEFGVAKYADPQAFTEVTSASFLPRLQLMGGNSELVKEGKIGIGRWALLRNKDQFVDLGPQVDALILSWRPKAMELKDNNSVVLSFFNPKDEAFRKVMEKSEVPNSGCMYGPEYLVWLPAPHNVYLSFFMASKTARREAPMVQALMHKFATLKIRLIKTAKFSWHGPVVTGCTTTYEVPVKEELLEQVNKFNNPPENEIESAPDDAGADGQPRDR